MRAQAGTTERELATEWSTLRRRVPQLRQREAATRLGVTEAELLRSQIGKTAVRLDGRWIELLASIEGLGAVKAVTRNQHAVVESWGPYLDLSKPWRKQAAGQRMDLRLSLSAWHEGFALEEAGSDGVRRSLQFFDERGDTVHKIYLLDTGNEASWRDLVARHERASQPLPKRVSRQVVARDQPAPDGEADDRDWMRPASLLAHRWVLEACRDQALPVEVVVENGGIAHTHTNAPRRVARTSAWWNVLDPGWNFHLRERAVAQAWVVRKVGRDRLLVGLELFDGAGKPIASLFAARGDEERSQWRAIIAGAEVGR